MESSKKSGTRCGAVDIDLFPGRKSPEIPGLNRKGTKCAEMPKFDERITVRELAKARNFLCFSEDILPGNPRKPAFSPRKCSYSAILGEKKGEKTRKSPDRWKKSTK